MATTHQPAMYRDPDVTSHRDHSTSRPLPTSAQGIELSGQDILGLLLAIGMTLGPLIAMAVLRGTY